MLHCPSCPLQEMPYADQLRLKQERLAQALAAHPRLGDVAPSAVLASPQPLGYRNRARMVVDAQATGPQALLGFYQPAARTHVAVGECPAHHPQLQRALQALRPLLWADAQLRAFTRFVDARATAGHAAPGSPDAILITLAGTRPEAHDLEQVEAHAARLFQALQAQLPHMQVSVHLNLSDDPSQAILGGGQLVIGGAATLRFALQVAGEAGVAGKVGVAGDLEGAGNLSERTGDADTSPILLDVPPTAFFQVNPAALQLVHQSLLARINPAGVLLDFYCGVGTHALLLAHALQKKVPAGQEDALRVLGFDIAPSAIEYARENAARAGIAARFVAADEAGAHAWLKQNLLTDTAAAQTGARTLLANPARAGIAPRGLTLIAALDPDQILYLSCHPETLARDLDRLLDLGYQVEHIEAFDFMPQTEQVETLAVLHRAQAQAPMDHERAYFPETGRVYSPGVSGPASPGAPVTQAVWVAQVQGEVPRQGFLPHDRSRKAQRPGSAQAPQQPIRVERLRKVDGNSVVRLHSETLDDQQLRRRLRAWRHPVLGDTDFGDRNANHLLARHHYLDRLALHCVALQADGTWHRAPLPGQFLAMMSLPRAILEEFEPTDAPDASA